MPDAALVAAIRAVLSDSPFQGEGHRKRWARLRIAGGRTSKRRVRRLMREHGRRAPARHRVPAITTAPSSPTGWTRGGAPA